jgi:hypothetical protein
VLVENVEGRLEKVVASVLASVVRDGKVYWLGGAEVEMDSTNSEDLNDMNVPSVVVRPVVDSKEVKVPSVVGAGVAVVKDEDVMAVEEMLENVMVVDEMLEDVTTVEEMLKDVSEDNPVVEVADELEVELVKGVEDSVVELAELDSDTVGDTLEDEDEDNAVELTDVVDALEALELTLNDKEDSVDELTEVEDENVGTSVVLELKLEEFKDWVVEGAAVEEEVSEEIGVAVSVVLVLALDEELAVTLGDVDDALVELSEVIDGVEDDSFNVLVLGFDVGGDVVEPVIVALDDDSEVRLIVDDELEDSEDESDVELDDFTEVEDPEGIVIVVVVLISVDIELELVGDGVFVVGLDEDSDVEESEKLVLGASVLLTEDVVDEEPEVDEPEVSEPEDELFVVNEDEELVGVDVAVDVVGISYPYV